MHLREIKYLHISCTNIEIMQRKEITGPYLLRKLMSYKVVSTLWGCDIAVDEEGKVQETEQQGSGVG